VPLHSAIAKEVFKVGVKAFRSYYRTEGKAFNSLYKGFPRGVARGVRHGLAAGSVAGTFIAPDTPGQDENAIQKPYAKRQRFTSRKSYKARGRRPRRISCRNPSRYQYRR